MVLTVGAVHEAIAEARAEEPCIVTGDRSLTWRTVTDRTRRFANVLVAAGLGCHTERGDLEAWESGQDHLAIYLHNGNEYLEAMLGAFKARVAPFNVNYRYVSDELASLLDDADTAAIVFHSTFAPVLSEVLPRLARTPLLFQVADGSRLPLLAGAVWYEDALALASADPPPVEPSPDDLYILYTGGTTGAPKGVLWRQGDALLECFGARREATTVDDYVEHATSGSRSLLTAPFMHGAGHWLAFSTWNAGGTVYVPAVTDHLDPVDVWQMVELHRIDFLLIVGDAFARPLLEELSAHDYDVGCLSVVLSGGAPLGRPMKTALLDRLPGLMILDGLGASESGSLLLSIADPTAEGPTRFQVSASTSVVSDDLDRLRAPGDPEEGWLAKRGRLALGYLGDPVRTARTFPTIDGVRYVIPGDRATWLADGSIRVHGRASVTINSGGEKIFAEEVEGAVKAHPDVADCVVAGRPSDRWGEEVVAIVELVPGSVTDAETLKEVAGRTIARFKLPKAFVFVDHVRRSPAGKADYRWARTVAEAGGER